MRRDSLFYQLFQQNPSLLFELLTDPPPNTQDYRFDCVVVKEPKFEIDGVFLPPEENPGTVYFCEVQFQKRDDLYEKLFAESTAYFYSARFGALLLKSRLRLQTKFFCPGKSPEISRF